MTRYTVTCETCLHPTVAVLAKLARALRVRVGDFFQRPGVSRPRRKRPPATESGPT